MNTFKIMKHTHGTKLLWFLGTKGLGYVQGSNPHSLNYRMIKTKGPGERPLYPLTQKSSKTHERVSLN